MNDSFPDALPLQTSLRERDYVVEEVLGQGGFGITYRARDNNLHRSAAIKEFFPHGAARDRSTLQVLASSALEFQNAKDQFLAEARALAQFNHPNIVDVYSVFEANDTAYMVMEFVRGSTLAQVVAAHGTLQANEALQIIEQIGGALAEVHRAGLLHLDVKPDNVMMEGTSTRAVLLDFGLTKKIARSDFSTMRLDVWSRFGTPGFAAMEQYSQHGQTGTWTDVYSLAATLYFLLVEKAPPEAATRATGTALPDVREFNQAVSTPVARAIESALRLNASKRPQNIEEFLALLHAPETSLLQMIPAPDVPSAGASTLPPEEDYNDPFGARDPNRPGPFRRPRTYNPVSNNPFGNNTFGNNPFTVLPLGFSCTSIGCSIGCFIFIAIVLLIIASLLNSVSSALKF